VHQTGWLTTGPRVSDLEAAFRKATKCQHAVAMSSGTAGMHLVLHALGIGPGDEVITPSLTWVSTVNLITLCGATPVFVDIERDTLMTTAELIEPLITPRTRAIIPVHFAGVALQLGALRTLAARHGITLIEDAAHALGSSDADGPIGQQGSAVFSLHPNKNVTTGEGGMLCTDDEALARRVRRLRFHGLEADTYGRETLGRAPQAEVQEPGFKYNLPDMNAALGLGQMQRLEQSNQRRGALADVYHSGFADVSQILPLSLPDKMMRHAWHLYVVRVDSPSGGIKRDEFMAELKARGIGSGLHFRAVHSQHYYRQAMAIRDEALPNTAWNSERVCSLPLFPDMLESDVERVVVAIKSIFQRRS
jgi:UDP-4-amino-4-deoxy-L-arabinose-oxoglutarate aminotransferase